MGGSDKSGYPACVWPEGKAFSISPLNLMFSSVQFSRSVMSNSLGPHELQRARPPGPSQTSRVYSDSFPLGRWCHPAISSSVVPFSSCPQSLPASGSFPMSKSYVSSIDFSQMPFITIRKFSFIPSLLRVCILNECWILSNTFSVPIETIILFFFYQCRWITLMASKCWTNFAFLE